MCGWDENNPGNDGYDISVIPGSYRQNKERREVTIVRHDDDGHLFYIHLWICSLAILDNDVC
jgi:hypothetical protein